MRRGSPDRGCHVACPGNRASSRARDPMAATLRVHALYQQYFLSKQRHGRYKATKPQAVLAEISQK